MRYLNDKTGFSISVLTLALVANSLAACTQESGDAQSEGVIEQPIIGGSPATDAKYDAVGALVAGYDFGYGYLYIVDFACSATLVAPQKVLTARHCTPRLAEWQDYGLTPAFAIGSDIFNPQQVVPITDWVTAPPSPHHPGLLLDGGRDVAVASLEAEPAGVIPASLGRFRPTMLGSEFEIIGFGDQGNRVRGEKFAGPVTARNLTGHWYERLFDGHKRDYLKWYFSDAVTSNPTLSEAREWWRIYRLEPGYELLAGGLEGEALGCFGDSGGPLTRGDSAEDLTVYGVSFATEASLSSVCTLGGAYAVLNRGMLDFVEAQL